MPLSRPALGEKGRRRQKLYRVPFDAVEEWSTGTSDQIVVNSTFTKSIFHSTFTHLSAVDPGVIYPCVDVLQPQQDNALAEQEWAQFMGQSRYFLSINRFERLKNVALAIRAYAKLAKTARPRLVIAGGFDARVRENVEYLGRVGETLRFSRFDPLYIPWKTRGDAKVNRSGLLPSVKNPVKNAALKSALCFFILQLSSISELCSGRYVTQNACFGNR